MPDYYEEEQDEYQAEEDGYYDDAGVTYTRLTHVRDCNEDTVKCCGTKNDMCGPLLACDTGCIGGGHVINDPALITEDHPEKKFRVQGYDNAESIATKVGHVPGLGTSAVIPNSEQCLVNMRKLCSEIGGRYIGTADEITIYDRDGRKYATATDHGDGFLSFRYSDIKNYDGVISANAGMVTQQQNMTKHYNAEEMVRAREAYNLCALMGHPGLRSLCATLDAGAFPDCHLTSQDAKNARDIFGKCTGCVEGKIIAPRATASKTQPAREVGEVVYMDLLSYDAGPSIGGYTGSL